MTVKGTCIELLHINISCYMQILQEANDELEDRIKSAEKELEESTAEMNKMTDEYTKLKV